MSQYPQNERDIIMGRTKAGPEYLRSHGYTCTETEHADFVKALDGKSASSVIRKFIVAYTVNPKIIEGM